MNETLVAPSAPDLLPARVRSRAVPIVCFMVAMLDGYDTLMLSFIAPLISRDWGLGRGAFGSIFAAGYAGAMMGAVLFGMAADRFGRKKLLLVSILIGGVFTVLCATAGGTGELMFWRFVAGVGLGGAIPSVSALTAEHSTAQRRSATVTRMFLGFPIGAVAGGAITASVMSLVGWRGVFVGGGVLSLLLLPIAFVMVTELRGGDGHAARRSARPFSELVADGRLFGTVLICLSAFLILLVSYFLISWTPTVLTLHGMSAERAAVAVSFDVNGQPISKNVEVLGPGDVVGINPRAIVKTEPRNWVTDFESNYLPYIEFYEEDLQNALSAAMSLIEPLILIVMGLVVGFILISLYMPIFSVGSAGVAH